MKLGSKFKTFHNDTSGVSAVEFAIVFPLLVMLVTGIIQLSSALFTESVMKHAIQEISRDAMVDLELTATDMEAEILKRVSDRGLTAEDITVTEASNGDGTATLNFELTYDYAMSIPFIFSKTIALKTTSNLLRRE